MLGNQWFVIATGNVQSIVDTTSLPAARREVTFAGDTGSITIFHGSAVLVEENDETYSLAVGDVRSLRNLAGFRHSGPSRHAALCVVDKRTGDIRVLTDRINFSKIFCFAPADGCGFAISSHLTFFDRPRLTLSIGGLASTIANGTQFNNSSVFRDVSVLDRAAIHEFSRSARKTTTYWHYGFDSAVESPTAKQQMKDVLVEAVRDQVADRHVLLSLSGGFDSSGILGILAKFVKPKSLKTFSYVSGVPKPGTDAYVAQQMAALTGYPHENVQAYDGDIALTIQRNARLGQGLSNFCDEIDAWYRQGHTLSDSDVLAGDECFGWADRHLVSREDVLVLVSLRRFEAAAPLIPYLAPPLVREMTDKLAADVESMLSKTSIASLHDLKDFLYLDQRIPWGLLPWRRFIIGELFEVREPFLQTEVLDVIKTLPQEKRIGKGLYRRAIQELVPEVFSIPRARSGQAAPDWKKEMLLNRPKIDALLKVPSALDAVIEPAAIVSLLDSLASQPKARPNWKMVVRQIVGPAATRALRSFVRPELPKVQSVETILLRLLVLREFLADKPASRS